MPDRTISIIGLGYIGLPTAAVIAARGSHVVGVDVSQEVVDTINRGEIHIVEPELDVVVRAAVSTGHLQAFTEPQPADAFLIAVPTPFLDDKTPDLSYIERAARAVASVLRPGNTVILESTSPVGATEKLCAWMQEERPDLGFPNTMGNEADIRVAHCPERVLPGHILRELVENDRVIGGMSERCAEAADSVYRLFVEGELVHTDVRTAEMCKLTENAFRDVNIAFANELSLVCDRYGINPWELIGLANRHPRVNILQPGPGVGGHCIAVDPWFLIAENPDVTPLMRAARDVNDYKPDYVVGEIRRRLAEKEHPVVACLGLAFKPDVDDLRESPALQIVHKLAAASDDAHLMVVEPHVETLPDSLRAFPNVTLCSLNAALESADLVVGLVRHRQIARDLAAQPLEPGRFLDFVNLHV